MKEEIKITKEDLVMWLDRPPSDDDFDLCSFLAKAVENQKKYYEENKSLQSQLKAKEEEIEKQFKSMSAIIHHNSDLYLEESNKLIKERQQLKEVIKEAREYVEKTQFYDNNNYFKNYLLKILSKGENK